MKDALSKGAYIVTQEEKKSDFFSKVNQVIYSSSPISILSFNIITRKQYLRYLAYKSSLHFIQGDITRERVILIRKRNTGQLSFHA